MFQGLHFSSVLRILDTLLPPPPRPTPTFYLLLNSPTSAKLCLDQAARASSSPHPLIHTGLKDGARRGGGGGKGLGLGIRKD